MKYKVAIGYMNNFNEIIDSIGGIQQYVSKNKSVFIKPNLCAPKSHETGTITNPYLIEKIIQLLKPYTNNIIIGDGPIPAFGKITQEKYPIIFEIANRYNIPIIDLNYTEKIEIDSLIIAKPVFDSDIIINVPVLKTHVRTGISVSLKNMMGIVPLRLKHEMHKNGLDRMIVKLSAILKPTLNIVDADICQEGDGPTNGIPRKLGLVVIGDNQVAVDSICCKIIGINPHQVAHLRIADKKKIGSIKNIECSGLSGKFINQFQLPALYRNRIYRSIMFFAEGAILKFFERGNKIIIDQKRCIKCQLCIKACPMHAITIYDQIINIDASKCILCLCCHEACLQNAIMIKKKGISKSGLIENIREKR